MESFVAGIRQSQLLNITRPRAPKKYLVAIFWRFRGVKVAIIGKGNVGVAIGKGLSGKHEVKFGHRNPN